MIWQIHLITQSPHIRLYLIEIKLNAIKGTIELFVLHLTKLLKLVISKLYATGR